MRVKSSARTARPVGNGLTLRREFVHVVIVVATVRALARLPTWLRAATVLAS